MSTEYQAGENGVPLSKYGVPLSLNSVPLGEHGVPSGEHGVPKCVRGPRGKIVAGGTTVLLRTITGNIRKEIHFLRSGEGGQRVSMERLDKV